jgi:hypothetical protein
MRCLHRCQTYARDGAPSVSANCGAPIDRIRWPQSRARLSLRRPRPQVVQDSVDRVLPRCRPGCFLLRPDARQVFPSGFQAFERRDRFSRLVEQRGRRQRRADEPASRFVRSCTGGACSGVGTHQEARASADRATRRALVRCSGRTHRDPGPQAVDGLWAAFERRERQIGLVVPPWSRARAPSMVGEQTLGHLRQGLPSFPLSFLSSVRWRPDRHGRRTASAAGCTQPVEKGPVDPSKRVFPSSSPGTHAPPENSTWTGASLRAADPCRELNSTLQ